MGDKLLDATQLLNGIAVLLSFFVGYKYALKRHNLTDDSAKGAAKMSESMDKLDMPFSNFGGNYKMVLVVRNDLKMGKGKVAAQCGHGAVGAYQKAIVTSPRLVQAWENTGCAKIALKVESEREMMAIKRAADLHSLSSCLIRDAGRTQIEPNSKTVLAIGPARAEDIDKVTGHLKLL
ncbi:probable peptidyl-tRNA hydrolase 2 [Teleopsis dalmanni]|uniref:probable peptidyl-tRNA hydrolase 2 n=1 Tax=Teleopsis dalmanni TaxID=139649 RepID=UPI0018CCBFD9|nr:probable peptidyl-tRNA hydrolase 2 [Teleopsis dalmanni]